MISQTLKILATGFLILGFCVGSASAQYGSVTPPPENLKPGFESITEEQAKEWLGVLAGPTFGGRGTGQPGFIKAAHWVAGKLAEYGVEPMGTGGTYFQMMPITKRTPDMKNCLVRCPNGVTIMGQGNLGFERYTNQAELETEPVFLTLVGENPRLPQDLVLRDKIVFYSTDDKAYARAPRMLARLRPAAAIRVIDKEPQSVPQTIFEGRRRRSTSVSGTIRREAANQIAGSMDLKPDWTKSSILAPKQKIAIQLRMREYQSAAPNVCGFIEGSDPELKKEYVVLGAHLDHLGTRGGAMYPGADDNGSGSTAILSIARAIALNPVKPKRSVLFLWFTAEENGLVGSRYYTDNPILPLENMTCMFNIDMVGRNEDRGEGDTDADNEGHIHLVGSQRGGTKLHDIVLAANQHIGFTFELDMESVWNRSDQVNFYNKGVPVAFMFGGFHPDYHQPSDQPAKINYKKIRSAARLYYLAIYGAANYGRFPMQQ